MNGHTPVIWIGTQISKVKAVLFRKSLREKVKKTLHLELLLFCIRVADSYTPVV